MHAPRMTIALLAVTGLAATAGATVVFDNFGPGDSWGNGAFAISGSDSFLDRDNDEGEFFTATQGGAIESFDLAVSKAIVGDQSGRFDIGLYTNANGVPGTELWNSGTLFATAPFGDPDHPPVHVDVDGAVSVEAGQTYWLVMSSPDVSSVNWYMNNINQFAQHAHRADGGPWILSSQRRSTFRVTLVPAPAGTCAFALGLAGLARRRR